MNQQCKYCSQPTPSRKRKLCDDCLTPGTRASRSPEGRANRSVSIKAAWADPEVRARHFEAKFASPEEASAKMTALVEIRWGKTDARAKAAQLVADGRSGFKSTGHPKYTSKAGQQYTFRSTWEYKVANYLDAQDIPWDYEVIPLTLNGEAYLPDFFLLDEYDNLLKIVEVKGYFQPKGQAKFTLFQEWLATQGIPLEIWDEPKLKELGIL